MKIRIMSSVMILVLSIGLISGCSSNEIETPDEPLYENYINLASSEEVTLVDLIEWMNINMMELDSDEASLVLLDFEEKHFEESFVIMDEFSVEDIEALNFETESSELKERVSEVLSQGYKFVAVEGSFNVIIDYSFYDSYKTYVTEDVMTYFELMKIESENVPLKDAAIVIKWRALFDRTAGWEKFITEFPESSLYDRGNQKLIWYLDWSFNGSPNTPVFEWDSKVMTDSYQEGIESFLDSALSGEFKAQMQIFYDMVRENDFKQNDEIKEFQEKHKAAM